MRHTPPEKKLICDCAQKQYTSENTKTRIQYIEAEIGQTKKQP